MLVQPLDVGLGVALKACKRVDLAVFATTPILLGPAEMSKSLADRTKALRLLKAAYALGRKRGRI